MAIRLYMKSFKKFIFPSTYIEKKKRSFYRVVGEKKIKNISLSTYKEQKRGHFATLGRKKLKIIFSFYLYRYKKEVKIQKIRKKTLKFILISNKKDRFPLSWE